MVWPINEIRACGLWPSYTPKHYYAFRVYDDSELFNYDMFDRRKEKSEAIRNCELWQKITSEVIPLEDIYQVVYKYSYETILNVSRLIESPHTNPRVGNQFVNYLIQYECKEIAEFLVLAKLCEKIRWEQNSPWYYPVEDDGVNTTLRDIARQAMAYKGTMLKDRYALQAIRALFASSLYERCINFWNDNHEAIPDGLIKEMIQPYIAGAYCRTGSVEQAMQIYAKCGDVHSLLYCMNEQGQHLYEIEQIELIYTYCPNSSAIASIIQRLICKAEKLAENPQQDEYTLQIQSQCSRLYEFALQAGKKETDRAMWYYTAAYIAELNGNTQEASDILKQAEAAHGSRFISESIQILRIYLDAKLLRYNSVYEQKLFGQLQWLDNKIKHDINDRIERLTANEGLHLMCSNISYYYWNDMLRKIVFSVLVPRYMEYGNNIRAIQLANMADNRLLNLINKHESRTMTEYRASTEWNHYDYCNAYFHLLDTIGLDQVIAYRECVIHPRSAFDRFLNERGYIGMDYLGDIIGTQCLREMRYEEAVKYFELVSSSYQYTLNTYKDKCMWRDPFDASSPIYDNSDYKYNFAREMLSLEQAVRRTSDPNRKAQMMIRYATGIGNSIDKCWALTQYYQGDSWEKDWKQSSLWSRANRKSKALVQKALSMFTDKESAAYSYWLLGNNKKVIMDYPETKTAELIKTQCDNWKDYQTK